ncbi:MAG: ATP-binding protein [Gammaproteobacteria bacterium]|nr:ATP-binding protein [Gammaproteobacteria bacterium]
MKIISIVGPESTGKTTLARDMARCLGGVWLPEYAREFLETPDYDAHDLKAITMEQWERERSVLLACPRVTIFDTDLVVIKIWWNERFGCVPEFVDERLANQRNRQYLLTAPDLEWEYDPLRESRDDRDRLLEVYKETLRSLGFEFTVISGQGSSRLSKAIAAVR